MITSIDGHSQDKAKGLYWMYKINGEMAPKKVLLKPLLKKETRSNSIKKCINNEESGTEIGNSLGIRFRRPHLHRLVGLYKADEISVVEPTQPLRLARQSKNN